MKKDPRLYFMLDLDETPTIFGPFTDEKERINQAEIEMANANFRPNNKLFFLDQNPISGEMEVWPMNPDDFDGASVVDIDDFAISEYIED